MTDKLASYCCRLGPIGAIGFNQFEQTLGNLSEKDRRMLLAAYIATCDLANGDAGKEIKILRSVIFQLRDSLLSSQKK